MSSLDVLLVKPWAPSAVPPDALVEDSLGVGYLAASLRQGGYSVAVLDAFTFQFDDEDIVRCILELSPKVLGISLHSFADYKHCVAISDKVAGAKPEIYRVLGGEHATFLARPILEKHPSVDAVVMGEGEETIKEIVSRVVSGQGVNQIAGAVTRSRDGSILDGGLRAALEDLDALPLPEKDIVETAILVGKPVALSLLTGRGCTHKCTFCTAHTYLRLGGGVVWRRRDPKAVVDEMESLVYRYSGRSGVHEMVQFQDVIFLGTSTAALEWTSRFLDELEGHGLTAPYYLMARAEAIIANVEHLPRLARSGLSSVEIGIESGVDRILQAYNKQNSVDRTIEAIQVLRSNGICYDASGFIMFDPRMKLDDVRTNALYLKQIDHATWDRYITKLQVFPGTAIRPQLIEEGLFDSDAGLDDVYAYCFEDPRVGIMASTVWFYSDSIRYLDNLMRSAKSILSKRKRLKNNVADGLQEALDLAQNVYCNYFLTLVDLVERDVLSVHFEEQVQLFLAQVNLTLETLSHFVSLEEDRTSSQSTVPVTVKDRHSRAVLYA
jgi:radical SAM superfamily enzyme YgiQ (UPF0313 family)